MKHTRTHTQPQVLYVNDHDHLLFFTAEGRAYSVRAYDVPEGGRTSVGTAIAQVRTPTALRQPPTLPRPLCA